MKTEDAEAYLREAKACIRLAAAAITDDTRIEWLRLARDWMVLALVAEGIARPGQG